MIVCFDTVNVIDFGAVPMIRDETLGDKAMNKHIPTMYICAFVPGIFQAALLLMVSTVLKFHRKNTAIVCDEIISRLNLCHDFSCRDVASGIHKFSQYDRFWGQSRIISGISFHPPPIFSFLFHASFHSLRHYRSSLLSVN